MIGCSKHPITPIDAKTVKVLIWPICPIKSGVTQQPNKKPKKCADPSNPISVPEKDAFIPAKASKGAIAPLPSWRKIVETISAEKDNKSPN